MSDTRTKKDEAFDRQASLALLDESLSASPTGKVRSYRDRVDGLLLSLDYLRTNMAGTGAALGMPTVNRPIAVGYVLAVVEAGVVGGLLYLCLLAIMGWLALKLVFTSNNSSFEGQVALVVALSVCSVLVMGAQRIQPDLSLWHMWLYAMLIYLLQKTSPSFETASASVTTSSC